MAFFQLDSQSSKTKTKKSKPLPSSTPSTSASGVYDAAEFYGNQDDSDHSAGSDSSEEAYEVPYNTAVATPDSFLPLITVEEKWMTDSAFRLVSNLFKKKAFYNDVTYIFELCTSFASFQVACFKYEPLEGVDSFVVFLYF